MEKFNSVFSVGECEQCLKSIENLVSTVNGINKNPSSYGGMVDSVVLMAIKNPNTINDCYALIATITIDSKIDKGEESLGFIVSETCPKQHLDFIYKLAKEAVDARLVIQNNHDFELFS